MRRERKERGNRKRRRSKNERDTMPSVLVHSSLFRSFHASQYRYLSVLCSPGLSYLPDRLHSSLAWHCSTVFRIGRGPGQCHIRRCWISAKPGPRCAGMCEGEENRGEGKRREGKREAKRRKKRRAEKKEEEKRRGGRRNEENSIANITREWKTRKGIEKKRGGERRSEGWVSVCC